jgi:hypothetical protein
MATREPRPQRYTVRLATTLDPESYARLGALIATFRRPRGQVLRQVLEWSVKQGQTGPVGRYRAAGRPHTVSTLVTPELAAQVHTTVEGVGFSLARWLRHALHQISRRISRPAGRRSIPSGRCARMTPGSIVGAS